MCVANLERATMASLIVQDPEDAYMEDVYVAELTSKASKKSTTTVVVD